ncbi:DUF5330 domain-containing protein [Hansschlegelia zhihuaiae]|uniref:DUF5330 domain-containing protein n=1 Tax=Hansschlegelia zhihuaiae TaxID=405005 RepID=A0A4Q0MHW5_9HYPH|nr:DUF5330 domain-containing protein [Hansschlegelia zhihuaiae]RXF72903.1 hypothetical protein EK403_12160 [Hansschlegelia zhihuaiae]
MFFLLRTAFWLSVLMLVLPFGGDPKGEGPNAKDRASIDAMSALAAAGATVSDVSGFCGRQPTACDVGAQALKLVGERAMSGAAAVQDYLAGDAEQARPVVTGSTPSASAASGTLTPADRKPAWRGPAA